MINSATHWIREYCCYEYHNQDVQENQDMKRDLLGGMSCYDLHKLINGFNSEF